MKSANFLPKAFRWLFTFLAVCTALGAVAVVVVMIADPSLPPDAHFGPTKGQVFGQPAEFALHPAAGAGSEPVFSAKAFDGNVTLKVEKAGGLVELLKHYGLPLLLIYALFFTALFELLRRLFRNVGRGDSFTAQSVRLVQSIGVSLIVFWLVSGLAGSWFVYAAWDFFSQHTEIAVSGAPLNLPPATDHRWFGQIRLFDWVLFSGLLVLALAEVFRQGLALKRDADLTV
ncbi:MAG: DUF2975 domain-containing protein [Alphaproteobacteria bacterium]